MSVRGDVREGFWRANAALTLKCSGCSWAVWNRGNAAPRPSGGSAVWELSLCSEPGWQLRAHHGGEGQNKQQIDTGKRKLSQ